MRYLTFTCLMYFIISGSLQANNCQHDEKTFRCVKYIKNYDGDTVTFFIPGVHPLLGNNISIRVYGVDTPEKRTKNLCEKNVANLAQKEVQDILKSASNINLENISRGKYFRIVANVIADGVDISAVLINKKLAYTYHGKTKKKIDWCQIKRALANE